MRVQRDRKETANPLTDKVAKLSNGPNTKKATCCRNSQVAFEFKK